MERAAWAVLSVLGLADKLQYVFGIMLMLFLFYELRMRRS